MNEDDILQLLAEMREAESQRPRTIRIFDAVMRNVDRGRDHLRIWEDTRKVVHRHVSLTDLAPSFFVLTGIAHLDAATLHAAKLFDRQSDSVNIAYLLNTIEADRHQPLFQKDWPTLKN